MSSCSDISVLLIQIWHGDCTFNVILSIVIKLERNVFNYFFSPYLKVPSFPDDVAMALIEEELGQPWQNIYSELSPSPIAAGTDTSDQTFASVNYSVFPL